jgi:hypothetical protein
LPHSNSTNQINEVNQKDYKLFNKSNRSGNGNGDRLSNGIIFNNPNEHIVGGYEFLSP